MNQDSPADTAFWDARNREVVRAHLSLNAEAARLMRQRGLMPVDAALAYAEHVRNGAVSIKRLRELVP